MRCKSCSKIRRFLEKGICIVCERSSRQKNTEKKASNYATGRPVKSAVIEK